MRVHTFTEHCYLLVLIQEGVWHFWAKERDFVLTDITHATRFDSPTAAKAVMTKARKKYKECPWFGIKETDEMIIVEEDAKVPVREVVE